MGREIRYNTLKISIAKNIHLMKSRDVTVVYSEEQNNQRMDSVGKMKSFLILKHVVHKITTVFSQVKT